MGIVGVIVGISWDISYTHYSLQPFTGEASGQSSGYFEDKTALPNFNVYVFL